MDIEELRIIFISLIDAPRFCNDVFPVISDISKHCLPFACSLSGQGLINFIHSINKITFGFYRVSSQFFYFLKFIDYLAFLWFFVLLELS